MCLEKGYGSTWLVTLSRHTGAQWNLCNMRDCSMGEPYWWNRTGLADGLQHWPEQSLPWTLSASLKPPPKAAGEHLSLQPFLHHCMELRLCSASLSDFFWSCFSPWGRNGIWAEGSWHIPFQSMVPSPLISPKTECSSNVVILLCLKACLARGEFASLLISGRRWWSKTGISPKEKFWMCQVCLWCLHKGASSVELEGHELWNLTDLDLASVPHQLYNFGWVTYITDYHFSHL